MSVLFRVFLDLYVYFNVYFIFWQVCNLLWAWNFKCSSRPEWLQTFHKWHIWEFYFDSATLAYLSIFIFSEYKIELLNIWVARQLSGCIKYFFICWCLIPSLTGIFRAQKYKLNGLRIQTKTQAFGTVQLLEPWRKVRQLRPILVLSFLAECWINYKASEQLSNFQSF